MTLVTLQPLARIEAHRRPQLSPLVSVYERSTRMTKDGASGSAVVFAPAAPRCAPEGLIEHQDPAAKRPRPHTA